MPVAFAPFGADNDRAAGNAWMRGVNQPLGGGGGGVVAGGGGVLDGGGGGVLDGGGGVVEDGGGGVVPDAATVTVTGMRNIFDPLGPVSEI